MKKISKQLNSLPAIILLFFCCCDNHKEPIQNNGIKPGDSSSQVGKTIDPTQKDTDAFHAFQIPVLAYHQIREWRNSDTKNDRVYIIPPDRFKEQIKMLHDSGFHAVLPDQIIAYLTKGEKLPARPVMISFDDGTAPQYTIGMPELNKYGFKGVFFIMTVVLGHHDYMTKQQVKDLAAQGHVVECHTWDHHPVTKYQEKDWEIQVVKPKAELEEITGKPVIYFAYPYGLWNTNAIEHLKNCGITAAFQLAEKQDKQEPLYTIRRIIADGNWDGAELLKMMKRDFKIAE